MIASCRKAYNAAFTAERYQAFLDEIYHATDHRPTFHIAETPLFVPKALSGKLFQACEELMDVICRPDFKELSKGALLPDQDVPGETEHSTFFCIDFGICQQEDGSLSPQLIEIQGFPSLYFYQHLCATAYRKCFDIPAELVHLFGGLTPETYREKLHRTIVGGSKPENVVLIDIEPHKQNTQVDFWATERALGVKVKCVSDLKTEGRDVYYLDENGRKVPVERIYNRVIFDELLKRDDLKRAFDFQKEYNIHWVGHPNWFARISKHTLPLFDSEFVPKSFYLNELDGKHLDLAQYVLKPLFSFSGKGVILHPTEKDIVAIPMQERSNFILQQKVTYAPLVETLEEPAKAEIRMMAIWEEGTPRPEIITNLVRLSKGEMIGVRYNMGKTWVGGSVGFFEV
ncbi:MAG: hypothetical protein H6577_08765 [Lewinellaceae bacterium]|nr:hypothetical protein [Saprospiraceae bacterium]MCB9338204.1 hypothetical protein [Lewinellaceae bacterium]